MNFFPLAIFPTKIRQNTFHFFSQQPIFFAIKNRFLCTNLARSGLLRELHRLFIQNRVKSLHSTNSIFSDKKQKEKKNRRLNWLKLPTKLKTKTETENYFPYAGSCNAAAAGANDIFERHDDLPESCAAFQESREC